MPNTNINTKQKTIKQRKSAAYPIVMNIIMNNPPLVVSWAKAKELSNNYSDKAMERFIEAYEVPLQSDPNKSGYRQVHYVSLMVATFLQEQDNAPEVEGILEYYLNGNK